jgi:hypothetical protein
MALREFTASSSSRRDGVLLLVSFLVVLPGQYLLVSLGWFSWYSTFVPVCAFVLMPLLAQAAGRTRRFSEGTTTIQWGLVICVFCISHVPAILMLDIAGYEGTQHAADRLPAGGRAIERRAAVRVGQDLRPPEGRTHDIAVEDVGGTDRWRGERYRAGSGALLDYAVRAAGGGPDGAGRQYHGGTGRCSRCRRSSAAAASRTGAT